MVNVLKFIDKFLKFLKTDRNTFLTYILTLLTVYIVVDRIFELLFMIFTGISVSYWGPITYTFALACPIFAFCFSFSSKFIKGQNTKLSFFYIYCIALYIIFLSMIVQWLNRLSWLLFFSVPNFAEIANNFSDLIKPAFTALALYLPLTTFYPLFKWLFTDINDTKKKKESIMDYGGINLSPKSGDTGPYTCEVTICKNKDTGKSIKIIENNRFESTLVVGVSGTGKTTMIFEPMIARDIEKKSFFREAAKEMAFTALRTGIAVLDCPYDNSYINSHFSLGMLTPKQNKEAVYYKYMGKLLYNSTSDNLVFKDLGITYMAPDPESINRIADVAKNFGFNVNIIDPGNPNSIGINPFAISDSSKAAIAISSILQDMYADNGTEVSNINNSVRVFDTNFISQAIENVVIILKEIYPRTHDGFLPNLEDVLKLLNDFDKIEAMCKQIELEEDLRKQYSLQLSYFKKNFYKNGPGRANTESFVHMACTQLDNLLRYPGMKNILCNRTNNIDFDKMLSGGEITLVCTRRGDLGAKAHTAFGLFFLLLMQYSVLSRPGNEKTRIPHFLYIDEFADFVCKATMPLFTMYRKYRVGSIVSTQSLAQLGTKDAKFRQIILGNSANKIVFGGNTPEENDWWSTEFGKHREWKWKSDYTPGKDGEYGYDPKLAGIEYGWKEYFATGKMQTLGFKNCAYKIKNAKGKPDVGPGVVDFLDGKYKKKQKFKSYSFDKYNKSDIDTTGKETDKIQKNSTIITKEYLEDINGDIDPIKTDTTDSRSFLNNGDAITYNLNKKKNNE